MGSELFPDPKLSSYRQPASNVATNSITGTAANSIFPGIVGSKIIPAGWLQPGGEVRLTLAGTITTALTPSATFNVVVAGTTIISGSSTSLVGSITAAPFTIVARIQCLTSGSSGTAVVSGYVDYPASLTLATARAGLNQITPFTVNTSIDNSVDLTCSWNATGHTLNIITATMELLPVS